MADPSIPADVRRLLSEQVRSLMSLELILTLRADPGRQWEVSELVRELRSSEEWVRRELLRLAERKLGVVSVASVFRFGCAPEFEPLLEWLAASYPQRRHSIIQAIYAAPSEPIHEFADAFRLRRENQHG